MNAQYERQTALVVRVLPDIAAEKCFAIKGGTAINLFEINLPRLSGEENAWGIPHFGDLPAIRWKRRNLESLRKSNPKKFMAQREALERLFEKGMVK